MRPPAPDPRADAPPPPPAAAQWAQIEGLGVGRRVDPLLFGARGPQVAGPTAVAP
jgi:hypothetical protein